MSELKDAIRREVSSIHPDMLHSAVAGFVTRLECLLPCGGGHVEHILVGRDESGDAITSFQQLASIVESECSVTKLPPDAPRPAYVEKREKPKPAGFQLPLTHARCTMGVT
ncbi:hypothetical protein TNCV_4891011 [Trichonephila clavipes]|nr:hypothetical protein TNCV_4891011 [Trichonephila clavipes]